jgi:hypothetical protein
MEPREFMTVLVKNPQWRPILSLTQSIFFGLTNNFRYSKNESPQRTSTTPYINMRVECVNVCESNRNVIFGKRGCNFVSFLIYIYVNDKSL